MTHKELAKTIVEKIGGSENVPYIHTASPDFALS